MKKHIDENYIVYSDGRVWSNKLNRFLNQSSNGNGYMRVAINRKMTYVHRLVTQVFLLNPNNFLEVNHIDGDKSNNNLKNLEWCDRRYNQNHFYKSKYPGVRKVFNQYYSRIQLNGKRVSLGSFNTPEEAHQAYLNALETYNAL